MYGNGVAGYLFSQPTKYRFRLRRLMAVSWKRKHRSAGKWKLVNDSPMIYALSMFTEGRVEFSFFDFFVRNFTIFTCPTSHISNTYHLSRWGPHIFRSFCLATSFRTRLDSATFDGVEALQHRGQTAARKKEEMKSESEYHHSGTTVRSVRLKKRSQLFSSSGNG